MLLIRPVTGVTGVTGVAIHLKLLILKVKKSVTPERDLSFCDVTASNGVTIAEKRSQESICVTDASILGIPS